MKLLESEKANPQDYYLQSGVDDEGNPIYDLVNEDVVDYAPAKALRKKVFDGNADIVVLDNRIQIYWKSNLIAEAELEGQVETSPGVWQGQLFSFADANIKKITTKEVIDDETGLPADIPITPFYRAYVVKDIPALGITNAVMGMDVHWAFRETKLSFYLDTPGFNARIRWQCRVKDSVVYVPPVLDGNGNVIIPAQRGLQFHVQDYPGEVNHGSQPDPETGWTQHWWTFEPDGKQIDAADSRTPFERYEQGVGLVVDPYLSVDENGTTITVYCSEDTITFTKATAYAVLSENTPNRVVVREQYYEWTLYDNRMFRWRHDTGGTTTGMSGNDYSAVQVAGELYWYPLTSYEDTNESAITTQLQDTILDQDPAKGDDVTDLILPARISSGTLHSDGAHHYDLDVNDELKFTLDRTRIRPNTVIHDWPFQYGSLLSPTDILLCHLKLDEQAASPNLADETANAADGTWSNISDGLDRDTDTAGDSVQVIGRGRNLDTQNGLGYIEMAVGAGTVHDNAFFKKGSFLISVIPQFGYDDATDQRVITLSVDGSNWILLTYEEATNSFEAQWQWGGSFTTLTSSAFSENYSLQRPLILLLSWDSDKDLVLLGIDGQIVDDAVKADAPGSSNPSEFFIGANDARGQPADMVIDNIKTFSECLLPYGAYFIGNGEGLLADIDNPHKDLSFFYDGQNSGAGAAKGGVDLGTDYTITLGGSAVLTTADKILGTKSVDITAANGNHYASFPIDANNFDGSYGSIGMWVNFQTLTSNEYFFGFGDATDYVDFYLTASNYFGTIWTSGGTSRYLLSTIVPTVGVWYFLKLSWDDTDYIDFYVNDILVGHEDSPATWSKTTGTMYLGADEGGWNSQDCLIGAFYITKDRYTPQIWTAFGKPLHIPLTVKG